MNACMHKHIYAYTTWGGGKELIIKVDIEIYTILSKINYGNTITFSTLADFFYLLHYVIDSNISSKAFQSF